MTTTRLYHVDIENADPHCTECGGNGFQWDGRTCVCCDRELPARCPSCESLAVDARNGQAECLDCGHSWEYA